MTTPTNVGFSIFVSLFLGVLLLQLQFKQFGAKLLHRLVFVFVL
ncbi:Uncharacterised protein [Vibrio cholerae]|nr:Uncharacterised protein [Vibrio cholerae]